MKTEYKFALDDLEKSLKDFAKNKITELTVQDENFAKDKKKILHLDWIIPFINDNYYYTNGFYFDRYY